MPASFDLTVAAPRPKISRGAKRSSFGERIARSWVLANGRIGLALTISQHGTRGAGPGSVTYRPFCKLDALVNFAFQIVRAVEL
jgi:hypothetical protein